MFDSNKQEHSGSGDNVLGDKTVNNYYLDSSKYGDFEFVNSDVSRMNRYIKIILTKFLELEDKSSDNIVLKDNLYRHSRALLIDGFNNEIFNNCLKELVDNEFIEKVEVPVYKSKVNYDKN